MNYLLNRSLTRILLIASLVISFVLVFILTAPNIASASGTTYYFSTSGSNSNDGLSPSAPKETISHALTLMNAGNTILFKRGDAWYNASLNLTDKKGTATNPITIGAYGTGAKPVIAGMYKMDAGWTNVSGTNRWQKSINGSTTLDAYRLFVNGVPKQKVTNASDVDQLHEWAIAGGIVYLYTGTTTVSPTNVEVIAYNLPSVVSMLRTEHVTVKDIDFRGGSYGRVIWVRSPSSHVTFDNIIVQRANEYGIQAGNLGSDPNDTSYVSHLTITNSLIDKVWLPQENDTVVTTGDGLFIHHAVDGAVIRGNKILNWGHSGIALTNYKNHLPGVKHVIVEQNDISNGTSGYMHGLDMNGYSGKTTNNIIRRNYIHDYTTTNHVLGSNNKIYGNIITGATGTVLPNHSFQPWGLDMYPWQAVSGDNDTWMESKDSWIINNTITETDQYSIYIGDNPGSPSTIKVENNVIANNIMYEYGLSTQGQVALNVHPQVTGTAFVRNNNFWDPVAQTGDTNGKVARYKNYLGNPANYSLNYDAAQLNSVCPSTCSNNIQMNPLFADPANRDYRLQSGSHTNLKTGALSYHSDMDRGYSDFFGTPFPSSGGSIGAIQYPGVTRMNLSAGIAPTFSSVNVSDPPPSKLTNGNTASTDYVTVGSSGELVYAQIDLGTLKDVSQIKMWHFHSDGRTYKDVVVQLSKTADFSSYVTTVFNNDKDNSSGQGYGSDDEYAESANGKTLTFAPVTARYARFWLKGNSVNANNNFVELQIFGTDPIAKLVSQYRDITYSAAGVNDPFPSKLTNGNLTSGDYTDMGNGAAHAVIDLGTTMTLNKIMMWHYFSDSRKYHDVIVQISNDADFSSYTNVFNNDTNNSAGQGIGADAEYTETSAGKTISFSPVSGRYVRFWLNGNTINNSNQFVELEVYGY
jgi:hypothetical protein